MPSYYSDRLSAERLKLCYDCAPPAVKRYLAAEIDYVRERSASSKRVLELTNGLGTSRSVQVVAGSSVFCEVLV